MRQRATWVLPLVLFACGGEAPESPRVRPSSDAMTIAIDTVIPSGPEGQSIRRGRALLANTRDSLPAHVGNKLRCMSCHLDEGRRRQSTWVGVHARYPQYRPRSATMETLEFRINDCFERSMHGRPLPTDSREMRDMIAYLAFLSRGVPVGGGREHLVPLLELRAADTTRGADVFATRCAICHGQNGEGTTVAPPTWGPESYNIGAGMSRLRTAATFIKYNMPLDRPETLTEQEAFDVAAYINSRPRPDYPGKELDWPRGGAPVDAAYPTNASR